MDFNGRMSMARASQPGTGRKQQEPDDAFMMVHLSYLFKLLKPLTKISIIAGSGNRNLRY
jgi:hypothetical protein